MPEIVNAVAFANNEVAFIAWELGQEKLADCLGFHIVREHLDDQDNVIEERPLASYVAFQGQRNADWQSQNTTVWPVQKFNWRDLTLRRRRDGQGLRPENERVRYRVRAVGAFKEGMEPVDVIPESHRDRVSGSTVEHQYQGQAIPLGYLTPAAITNVVVATTKRGQFQSTFTNGILSTQFLVRVLQEQPGSFGNKLLKHLKTKGDWLREYLAGDVITLLRNFFQQPGGRFYAALYELEDEELEGLLAVNAERISLILSDAGKADDTDAEPNANGNLPTLYDTRNAPARKMLRKLAKKHGTEFRMQDRLFNGTGHIGHNKFIVYVDDTGAAQSVLAGSTNWTFGGLAAQTNNAIQIDDPVIADAYLNYWHRLLEDVQPSPEPLSARNTGAGQSDDMKNSNTNAVVANLNGAQVSVWYSPNVPGKKTPPSPKATKPGQTPPDMASLFNLMRKAKRAIFFLVFSPSRGGLNSIVSQAVELGMNDPSLNVVGAISDSQAMWGYEKGDKKREDGTKTPSASPHVFSHNGVSVVRATALTDKDILTEIGDFKLDEALRAPGGIAIIHDKILVIDPADAENCVVAFGSHNLGYRASYANDENLVVVRGHRSLALAYAAHVLDVYDHYRFRAAQAASDDGESVSASPNRWDGFLDTTDAWQEIASRRMSKYFTETLVDFDGN